MHRAAYCTIHMLSSVCADHADLWLSSAVDYLQLMKRRPLWWEGSQEILNVKIEKCTLFSIQDYHQYYSQYKQLLILLNCLEHTSRNESQHVIAEICQSWYQWEVNLKIVLSYILFFLLPDSKWLKADVTTLKYSTKGDHDFVKMAHRGKNKTQLAEES